MDIGHGKTCVAPVNEGQLQAHGMQKLNVAGEDMSILLKDLVGKLGTPGSCGVSYLYVSVCAVNSSLELVQVTSFSNYLDTCTST